MEIIAHRGASHDAPENTLAAVNLAWQQNADAVEIDVHLSRDGQLVVIHDENTRKTAGLNKSVSAQTLAELRRLDVGRWKGPQWAGEKIPALAEVLGALPAGKRLFIEVKSGDAFIPAFADEFARSRAKPEQIVLIGFSLPTMALAKRAFPKSEVCWVAEFKRTWLAGRWRPSAKELIEPAREAGIDGLDLGAQGPLDAALVRQVKGAGLSLYVWTVDSPAQARRLASAGVDGITTNRPAWLRQKLGLD